MAEERVSTPTGDRRIGRRSLVRGAAAGAAAVAGALAASRPEAPAAAAPADFSGLTGALSPSASLFVPGDASYEALAAPRNHQFASVRPAAILVPSTGADVQAGIAWARSKGVRVTPRSGEGHNYAGYSNSTGLLMLMSRFRDIQVTPSSGGEVVRYGPSTVTRNAGSITVGAGVTNADLHPLLENKGYLVPTGRCATVGVAGLALGGGIGFSDKMAGLTCDRLLSTTVVLADGRTVVASPGSEPDLYWASRGGAGNNFGVHTDFTFSFDRIEGRVTTYSFRWSMASALAAMRIMQEVCVTTRKDRRFHARLGIGTTGTTKAQATANATVTAEGQFYGSRDELATLLSAALSLGTATEQIRNAASIQELSAAEASSVLNRDSRPGPFTSACAILDAPLTEAQVGAAMDSVRAWPGSSRGGADFALFALGGAINEVAQDATAFVHRSSLFIVDVGADWGDDDPKDSPAKHRAWLDDAYRTVFGSPTRMYANFPDPNVANAQQAYYGANYARLRAVKRRYDPDGFFWYPQGVMP